MAARYPLLDLRVTTPRLELRGATDDLLERLIPYVREGVFDPDGPLPFDDPMSLYEDGPDREWRWLRAIWAGRGRVEPDEWWRLYFVVVVDDEPVGVQDLTGVAFRKLRSVTTFSWLGRAHQRRGLGKEMRQAVLHLAFAGLAARRALSEAFDDNEASNAVSRALGYAPNGTTWATRRGAPARMTRYELTAERWEAIRRDDISVTGIEAALPLLGLDGVQHAGDAAPTASERIPGSTRP